LLEAAGAACCVAEDVAEVAAGAEAVLEVAAVVCNADAVDEAAVADADEV
jgi:hypothetical protein